MEIGVCNGAKEAGQQPPDEDPCVEQRTLANRSLELRRVIFVRIVRYGVAETIMRHAVLHPMVGENQRGGSIGQPAREFDEW